ncbi:MAG TPA: hypothetical protein VFY28_01730 [Candidatus Paceibacterota bacterium]|nr:hypothetical protein [Candidatus Paceibacterota bacterium]
MRHPSEYRVGHARRLAQFIKKGEMDDEEVFSVLYQIVYKDAPLPSPRACGKLIRILISIRSYRLEDVYRKICQQYMAGQYVLSKKTLISWCDLASRNRNHEVVLQAIRIAGKVIPEKKIIEWARHAQEDSGFKPGALMVIESGLIYSACFTTENVYRWIEQCAGYPHDHGMVRLWAILLRRLAQKYGRRLPNNHCGRIASLLVEMQVHISPRDHLSTRSLMHQIVLESLPSYFSERALRQIRREMKAGLQRMFKEYMSSVDSLISMADTLTLPPEPGRLL